jgi:hypothetical protein
MRWLYAATRLPTLDGVLQAPVFTQNLPAATSLADTLLFPPVRLRRMTCSDNLFVVTRNTTVIKTRH